jgi:DNA-binding transcriptional ArsR family regulator
VLRKLGLVTVRKDGRWAHYRRTPLSKDLGRLVDLAAPPRGGRCRSCA